MRSGSHATCSVCGETGHNASRHRDSIGAKAARLVDETGCTYAEAGDRFGVSREAVRLGWVKLFGARPSARDEIAVSRRRRVVIGAVQGKTVREIADDTGPARMTVYRLLEQRGIKAARPQQIPKETWAAAFALISAGSSYAEAAAETGVSRGALARRATASGIASTATSRGRMDGRGSRAAQRVLAGETIAAACRAERCAPPGVIYALTKLRREVSP